MQTKAFFDKDTSTLSYVVYDENSRDAVIIDPVLDFDPASGRLSRSSADHLLNFVHELRLKVHLVLETHAHADHLSSSQLLKSHLPGSKIAIGSEITKVQQVFKDVYGLGPGFATDGSQFDLLLTDQQVLTAGTLRLRVIFTPGHTAACASYLFDDHVFTGDALFMPDYGTGRTDFPGGNAEQLYDSIKRLYALPETTVVLTGHDYQPQGRPLRYASTIGEEKSTNIHLTSATSKEAFVRLRQGRDAVLGAPKLLHPSVQVNIAAGHLPTPEASGRAYIKIPLSGVMDFSTAPRHR